MFRKYDTRAWAPSNIELLTETESRDSYRGPRTERGVRVFAGSGSINRTTIENFAALLLFWFLLSGSLATDVLLTGVAVALFISLAFRSSFSFFADFRFTPQAVWATIQYLVYFFIELIKANFSLALIVLSPSLPIKPGLVKVHTRLKTPMGRLLLANSITLTPGTLSVDLDGEWLYVHWVTMETDEVEEASRKIVQGFEQYLEVMYG